ncbi:MAG TPA: NADP-dependent oxidoreductase [Candidatus Nitrosotalea sp.]|nr:NADP-dependent oxidoreductase [Candidatus Nitrosotalea sp.]
MKAVVVDHLGASGTLKEIPVPRPAPNEILVRVVAAGVNPIDWKLRERASRDFPFVLGQDFAGVVSAAGNRVTKYREGERVFGTTDHGSYAEYTIVPEDDPAQPVSKISDAVGDADAAALPTAGITALAALKVLQATSGMTLLVLGATGGVGMLAVQIARDRGLHVAGTARAASEGFARSLGVEAFIAYDRDDVAATVKAAHPSGIDAALDLVDDGEAIKKLAGVIRPGGRLVSTIHSADVVWFAERMIEAQNIVAFESPPASHADLRLLLELVEQQRMRVVIAKEYPLIEAVDALDESKRGAVTGKLVITVI